MNVSILRASVSGSRLLTRPIATILVVYWIEPFKKSSKTIKKCYERVILESETGGIQRQLAGFYDRIHADGVQNVQWGSCSAPLTVTVFMIMSMGMFLTSYLVSLSVRSKPQLCSF